MIRYEIEISERYTAYQKATVIVEAYDEEEAREKAREMYDNGEDADGNALEWCDYYYDNNQLDSIVLGRGVPIKRQYVHTRISK